MRIFIIMNKPIKVRDIINTANAISHSFGLKVYQEVLPVLKNGNDVVISFEGIRNLSSGFCNASIGKLFLDFPDQSKKQLEIEGIENSRWKRKVEDAIELATNKTKRELHEEAIADLF